MGIAGFYLWLQRYYGSCVEDVPDFVVQSILNGVLPPQDCGTSQGSYDNLYLDMNGLIHPCCHDTAPLPEPKSEEEMFDRVFAQLDIVYKVVRPRKCLVLCIDGVAPQSKMNQQRSRRFRAAEERIEGETLSEKCAKVVVKKGLPQPNRTERWDHNVITPSTAFMERVGLAIEWFVVKKLNEDPAWRNIAVIFSDAHVPGEGEHKIMQYIRGLRAQPGYNPRTSHVIYGMDADLVCLGLSTHEENVTILRNQLTETFQPGHNRFCYFSLYKYRQRLKEDFGGIQEMDFERVLDDFIFLCFFVGNDFLPHVPLISIKTKGIELLLHHYVDDFAVNSYLTDKGEVKFPTLFRFLQSFVQKFMTTLKREYGGLERVKNRAKGNVAERTKQGEEELTHILGSLLPDRSNAQEVSDAAHRLMLSITKERTRFVAGRDSLGFSYMDDNHRDLYYEKKFGWDSEQRSTFEENVKRCCAEYLRGTQWVMRYYTSGCPSWDWFYPYHYAPLLQDLAQFTDTVDVAMVLSVPRHPVVQLLAVMPRSSIHALPKELHSAVQDRGSVLGPFYPDTIDVDFSEANFSYQGVLRLPFIDNQQLQVACQKLVELEPDHGVTLLFCHESSQLSSSIEALLAGTRKSKTMQRISSTVASTVPIAGSVGYYDMEWPRHADLHCPDDGIAKNTSCGTDIKDNRVCCYQYELNVLFVYKSELLKASENGTKRKRTTSSAPSQATAATPTEEERTEKRKRRRSSSKQVPADSTENNDSTQPSRCTKRKRVGPNQEKTEHPMREEKEKDVGCVETTSPAKRRRSRRKAKKPDANDGNQRTEADVGGEEVSSPPKRRKKK